MLTEHPIDVVPLAADLEVAKDFYANRIGLEILDESPFLIQFRCGGDARLVISRSNVGTADEQTQASWRVTNLAAELAGLRSRGVGIQEYDMPRH